MSEAPTPAQLNALYREFWARRTAFGEAEPRKAERQVTADSALLRPGFVGRARTYEPPLPLN